MLIRHGETEANEKGMIQGPRVNAALNEKGRQQAKDLGALLNQFNVKVLCTSTLERAKQTAAHVKGSFTTLELKELNQINYGGEWDGAPLQNIMSEIRQIAHRWSRGETHLACPDGGESPQDVLDRATKALFVVVGAMESSPNDAVAVIVAHNFVNKILLSHNDAGSIQHMHKFDQQHTCVNVLDVQPASGRVQVQNINYHDHVSRL